MRKIVWAALVTAATAMAQPAMAEDIYDGLTFEQLKAVLTAIPGLSLNEKSTEKGNRYFEAVATGGTVSFLATMASCPEDRKGPCDGIAFLNVQTQRPMTIEQMAQFNRQEHFVKAKPSASKNSSVVAGEFFARGVGLAFVKTSCAYYIDVLERNMGGSSVTTMNGQPTSSAVSFASPESADTFFATLAQRGPQRLTATAFDAGVIDAVNGRKR